MTQENSLNDPKREGAHGIGKLAAINQRARRVKFVDAGAPEQPAPDADQAGAQARPRKVSLEEIEAAKSSSGGYTKSTLESWGVAWPPVKGWKEKLLGGS